MQIRWVVLAVLGLLLVACSSQSTPTPTPPPATNNATGSVAVISQGGKTFAFVPTPTGFSKIQLADSTGLTPSSVHTSSLSPATVTLNPVPDACAADYNNAVIVCTSFQSSKVSLINASDLSVQTVDTGLTDSESFSGGSCIICGALYDPKDNRMIFSTKGGYRLFDHTGSKTFSKTIAVPIAENFGYNPTTNQIFSPRYGSGGEPDSLDLVDLTSAKRYSLSPTPTGLAEPDHGAIDTNTNIAVTANEYNPTLYLINLNSPVLDQPAVGQFQGGAQSTVLKYGGSCAYPLTDIAVDSSSHIALFMAEFCSGSSKGSMGVLRMPTSSTATLVPGDYVFSTIPAPSSVSWTNPGDPHGLGVFTLSSSSKHYGLLLNGDKTSLAVVDLEALLAAPRDPSDANAVNPSYDLVANKVMAFYSVK